MGKIYLSKEQLKEAGFIENSVAEKGQDISELDPRNIWHEIELFKSDDTSLILSLDAYADFSLECSQGIESISIPLNFQTAEEIKSFVSVFTRESNHAFTGLFKTSINSQ